MKLIIGGAELEIQGDVRLIYDGSTGALSINPGQSADTPTKRAKALPAPQDQPLLIEDSKKTTRRGPKGGKRISDDRAPTGLTKSVLTHKVLAMAKEVYPGAVAIQTVTMTCLGIGSSHKEKEYLKILIDELVNEGKLETRMENNRRRIMLPISEEMEASVSSEEDQLI